MTKRNLSLSLLLAIALGFSACGGGGSTPQVNEKGNEGNQTVVDNENPSFATNLRTTYTIVENSVEDIATIDVTDKSPVTFKLVGADAQYFELINKKESGETYEVTLRFKDLPDFEEQSDYKVTVVATDSYGNSAEKEFAVHLDNEPFAFDTTGDMGSVETGKTKTLVLSTKEAKGPVKYKLVKGDPKLFVLDQEKGTLTFKAPVLKVNENENKYKALARASDLQGSLDLPISVQVIAVGGKPAMTSYLLREKEEREILVDNTLKTNYAYEYDTENYLTKIIKTGTNVNGEEVTVFEYDTDHKIMRGYINGGVLDTIRVFADKKTFKRKFPAMLYTRLSSSENVVYMDYISDSVEFNNNRHLVKYIYGLKSHQRTAEIYVYNADDTLSRKMVGNYDMRYEKLIGLTDDQLKKEYTPSGGYPSGDVALSATQRVQINSGVMPFYVSYETTYSYENGKLKKRNYFDYATGARDSSNISVKYFTNGVINMISTNGITITYNTNSLLESVNNYTYQYNINGQNVDVTVRNGNTIVSTYKFEEE